jgi:glyoxylase-like metal-dependent hydrolase (beta-lactamase superfamily II)|tara:strand:+ start:206 stop:850 length:645 start_codon:yes stop_codon:yes gene_type:complete
MNVHSFQGGFDKNLSYLVWCNKTKIAAIIDPSVEINPIIELIQENNLFLNKIFITHTHHDHFAFLDDFKYLYPSIEVYCSKESNKQFNHRGLSNNEISTIGEELLVSLHTPGHYYDSLCFWNESSQQLFTGDTMFVGRSGRTISKKSDIKQLYHSIYNIILSLPLNTQIYPGHHYGYKKSVSLNDNIKCSKFFDTKSLSEFIKVMENFELYRLK